MQQPPVPEPRDLLPPLLACLPTTFLSHRPPPALLPLLAPILRQRITYLAAGDQTGSEDGWARLLCWDSQQAAKLPSVIERLDLEPHPVSGEVEIDDVLKIEYRRLDDETLQARLYAEQFALLPIYVWCQDDEHGQTGPGWKLTELRALEDAKAQGGTWSESIAGANSAFGVAPSESEPPRKQQKTPMSLDDNDDSYWAAYDQSLSQTPAAAEEEEEDSASPIVKRPSARPQTEDDYYARYGEEVQPALDAHDPSEDRGNVGHSTLDGTSQRGLRPISLEITTASPASDEVRPAWQKALYPHAPKASNAHDSAIATSLSQSIHSDLNMPRPISPASSSGSVEKLEEQAAALSGDHTAAARFAVGVKQHVSTEIKSLFRLGKTVGMTRSDFEELVRREMDVLCLLDDD